MNANLGHKWAEVMFLATFTAFTAIVTPAQNTFIRGDGGDSTPPRYCNPCLFYGGDFDPGYAQASADANEHTVSEDITLYVPFAIPGRQHWEVDGLFVNTNASDGGKLDPPDATWSISKNVTKGNGGIVLASGTSQAEVTPTGRLVLGALEFTVLVKIPGVILDPGEYWLSVVPQCTNPKVSCNLASFYLSNTDKLNSYGPSQPAGQAFLNNPSTGNNYVPLCQLSSFGCQWFSAGVLGRLVSAAN